MQPNQSHHSATESRNLATESIDLLSTLDLVRAINAEDALVAPAVRGVLPAVAAAIDAIRERMRQGGRLIYVGAGTSGRLGALDAYECAPTYNVPVDRAVACVAGLGVELPPGVDGEDDVDAGAAAIAGLGVMTLDSVVGIAASGRTPYVLGAMNEAQRRGALVVSLACVDPSPVSPAADIAIAPVVGPEVITGSTRMKAGTAQKMVLNMLSTGVMIRLGKTYGNLMVDMQASNAKLHGRACRIVAMAGGLSVADAALLRACDGEVKTAIVVALTGVAPADAREGSKPQGGGTKCVG
ncbi:MAG: N-acetylmuramic acid 6-phosphate etherase [Anaerolineales bacterium]|nr:N-acetylmuramic acid 6-phosphate etherase [Anaerolineales bacterium]